MRQFTRREFVRATAQGACAVSALGVGSGFLACAPAARDPFARLDALAQADLVRTKQATPLELLEAAIARAEALNPKLNAIVTPLYDMARTRAAGPLPDGPFTGVPTLLKDLLGYKDVRLTFGSRFFKDNVSTETHPVATRMERSGMVVFGKTNTPEFGLLPTTEGALLGATNNPWNPAYSPGGSSGGAAAAVASGIVSIAQASDGGGSIRIPACNCGLFGMKPTRARVPEALVREEEPGGLPVTAFVTRTVRDSKAGLSAIARTPAEGSALPPPVYGSNVKLRPLRIAFSTQDLYGRPAHAECVQAVQKTAKLCEQVGHHVEEAQPKVDGQAFNDAFLTFWCAGAAGVIQLATEVLGEAPPRGAFEPWTWSLVDYFAELGGPEAIPAAEQHMQMVTQTMATFHEQYDVWLTPVLGRPALRTGEADQTQPFDTFLEQMIRYVGYTPLANCTGQPAMSVPLHWTSAGIPVGSHFLGRTGEEALLFALAEQLETAQPWADRWPPISATNA